MSPQDDITEPARFHWAACRIRAVLRDAQRPVTREVLQHVQEIAEDAIAGSPLPCAYAELQPGCGKVAVTMRNAGPLCAICLERQREAERRWADTQDAYSATRT